MPDDLANVLTTADFLNAMPARNRLAGAFASKDLPNLADMLRERQGGMLTKEQADLGYGEPHRDVLSGTLPGAQNALGRALSAIPEEAMLAANFLSPGARLPRIPNPIKAYHGSPHDFNEFSLSKIGTGEGAQAYGHGLYFAESEPVAKSYRDALAPANVSLGDNAFAWGKNGRGGDPALVAKALKLSDPHEIDVATEIVGAAMRQHKTPQQVIAELAADGTVMGETAARLKPAFDSVAFASERAPGKMYEVALHATPEQFLDWDKPLAGQSEAVRNAIEPLRQKVWQEWQAANPTLREPTHLGQVLAEKGPEATAALSEQGIPGIRYLDQGSRDKAFRVNLFDHKGRPYETEPQLFSNREMAERYAAEKKAQGFGADIVNNGTSNYVVFDPSIIEILRKYGLAGPVALGAANALSQDQAPQQ